MENQEIRKHIKAIGVPKLLWDWSITESATKYQREFKKYLPIKNLVNSGYSISIKLKDDLLASRLSIFLLKNALKEDFILVDYHTPVTLTGVLVDSWEGSESYRYLLKKDLVVVDQMTKTNFSDKIKVNTFTNFVTERVMAEKTTVIVQSAERIHFSDVFVRLLQDSPMIYRVKEDE
jgi:hypothetical protein